MFKYIESNFTSMHYASYDRIIAVPGSTIEMISTLAEENCRNSNLIVIKSGVNNILNDYSVSNCMYLIKKAFRSIRECCPVADVAFMDISLIAENARTNVDFSSNINPKIRELNDALQTFCEENNHAHFINLKPYLCSNDPNTEINHGNLSADGLHYSVQGNFRVAGALIKEVESLKQMLINNYNCETKLCSKLAMLNRSGNNFDMVWPALPEPAKKSMIYPATFPGQQYVDVPIDKRTHGDEKINKFKTDTTLDQQRKRMPHKQILKKHLPKQLCLWKKNTLIKKVCF